MATERTRRIGNYVGWARDSTGYLKTCYDCGRTIYLHHDNDGTWRPYASWVEGDAAEGEFILHDCPTAANEAAAISSVSFEKLEAQMKELQRLVEELVQKRLAGIGE